MALRPTELQIILAATRDIERAQQLQQQQPRSQQDSLTLQFQHEIEQRRRQTQAAAKSEQSELKKVSTDEKNQTASGRKRKMGSKRGQQDTGDDTTGEGTSGEHVIDLLI
jgi:hypothetical protein